MILWVSHLFVLHRRGSIQGCWRVIVLVVRIETKHYFLLGTILSLSTLIISAFFVGAPALANKTKHKTRDKQKQDSSLLSCLKQIVSNHPSPSSLWTFPINNSRDHLLKIISNKRQHSSSTRYFRNTNQIYKKKISHAQSTWHKLKFSA